MQIGKQIKTLEHAIEWCLMQHNPVFIKSKIDGSFKPHGPKVIETMPLRSLYKMIKKGKLHEQHR
jgi:hypothetical protein